MIGEKAASMIITEWTPPPPPPQNQAQLTKAELKQQIAQQFISKVGSTLSKLNFI